MTVTSKLESEEGTEIVQLVKGSKNKRRQTKNIWRVNYFIQIINIDVYCGGQLRDISEVSEVAFRPNQSSPDL